jgi:hypothetical protein
MDISVIIVNYNVYEHIKHCIKSIKDNLNDYSYEIFVVDNNSMDRSIEKIVNDFPDVLFIQLPQNAGFGAANNAALNKAKGNYLLFVNPDIIFLKDCIHKLILYIEKDSKIGITAPVLYTTQNKVDYYYSFMPSLYSIIMQQFGLYNSAHKMSYRMRDYLDEKINLGEPFEVEQVMGACFLTRKNIYDKIGGFDEIFFLYQEETDWELRMSKLGYKIIILPEARVIHDHHSSANKLGKIYVGFHGIRSIILYSFKNFDYIKRSFLRITMFIALILRFLNYIIVYIAKPQELKKSLYYTIKLFMLNLTPRKYALCRNYKFQKNNLICISVT